MTMIRPAIIPPIIMPVSNIQVLCIRNIPSNIKCHVCLFIFYFIYNIQPLYNINVGKIRTLYNTIHVGKIRSR